MIRNLIKERHQLFDETKDTRNKFKWKFAYLCSQKYSQLKVFTTKTSVNTSITVVYLLLPLLLHTLLLLLWVCYFHNIKLHYFPLCNIEFFQKLSQTFLKNSVSGDLNNYNKYIFFEYDMVIKEFLYLRNCYHNREINISFWYDR